MKLLRIMLLAFSVLVGAALAIWYAARPATPDMFYDTATVAGTSPGMLLRSELFVTTVPPGALAMRILYSTTRADGSPAAASAVVVVSSQRAPAQRPVIAWAHGTTGIARGCAPSVMPKPFANVPGLDEAIAQGWAFVATDYVGLGTDGGHAYLIGDEAARSVLDAVRAARKLPDFQVGDEVVVWGHSQGGNSALWTGALAVAYAPDLNISGVLAMAPASDLRELIDRAQSSMFGKIVSSYVTLAYAASYPDVVLADYIQPNARLIVDDIGDRCVGGWETLVSAASSQLLPRDGIFAQDPASGAFGARLQQNTPAQAITSPVLIAQGDKDDLVFADIQARYVASRCAAGQPIDYRVFVGLDHISLVGSESPLVPAAVEWTSDRFAGRPATPNC